MIRISKIADYAVLLVVHIAVDRSRGVHSARDLSKHTRVPLPTASKILKALGHAGLRREVGHGVDARVADRRPLRPRHH